MRTDAGFAGNQRSSPVNGSLPKRFFFAGTACTTIFSRPDSVNSPAPFLCTEPRIVSSSADSRALRKVGSQRGLREGVLDRRRSTGRLHGDLLSRGFLRGHFLRSCFLRRCGGSLFRNLVCGSRHVSPTCWSLNARSTHNMRGASRPDSTSAARLHASVLCMKACQDAEFVAFGRLYARVSRNGSHEKRRTSPLEIVWTQSARRARDGPALGRTLRLRAQPMPNAGSLMLPRPVSTWPANPRSNEESVSTNTARSYQPWEARKSK